MNQHMHGLSLLSRLGVVSARLVQQLGIPVLEIILLDIRAFTMVSGKYSSLCVRCDRLASNGSVVLLVMPCLRKLWHVVYYSNSKPGVYIVSFVRLSRGGFRIFRRGGHILTI